MKILIIVILALILISLLSSYISAVYFFNRTINRKYLNQDSTLDMAETNWDLHIPRILEAKKWTDEYPRKILSIKADDGLNLAGVLFENEDKNANKLVIAFHGYTSEGQKDYIIQTRFFLENGFHVMLVDQRAHGNSEGKYVGFGVLDSNDSKKWIDYAINRFGEKIEILLYGTSMGGATTLMTFKNKLPSQVKAAISDCAFTNAWNVFSHVLKVQYHLPIHPLMDFANKMCQRKAGYALDEIDARKIMESTDTPILFIHGDKDDFVPVSMVYELYEKHRGPKKLLVVKDAMHFESFYLLSEEYLQAIKDFIFPYFS